MLDAAGADSQFLMLVSMSSSDFVTLSLRIQRCLQVRVQRAAAALAQRKADARAAAEEAHKSGQGLGGPKHKQKPSSSFVTTSRDQVGLPAEACALMLINAACADGDLTSERPCPLTILAGPSGSRKTQAT